MLTECNMYPAIEGGCSRRSHRRSRRRRRRGPRLIGILPPSTPSPVATSKLFLLVQSCGLAHQANTPTTRRRSLNWLIGLDVTCCASRIDSRIKIVFWLLSQARRQSSVQSIWYDFFHFRRALIYANILTWYIIWCFHHFTAVLFPCLICIWF